MARTSDYTYLKNRAVVLETSTLCWLCGFEGADSADHYIPVSKGGDDSVENLRPAHLACNRKRHNKDAKTMVVRQTGGVSW